MYTQATCRTSPNATFLPASACGPLRSGVPDGATIDLFGPVPVLANLSARQAKALGFMMSGTSGQPSTTSSKSAALQRSLESRLQAKTSMLGSTLYTLTMEAMGYAFGSVPFPSAGVGAPHIRDRNYWVAVGLADSNNTRLEGRRISAKRAAQLAAGTGSVVDRLANTEIVGQQGQHVRESGGLSALGVEDIGSTSWLADTDIDGRSAGAGAELHNSEYHAESRGGVRGMADDQLQQRQGSATGGDVPGQRDKEPAAIAGLCCDLRPGPTNGFWRDADWLGCTDGKWRPVEPGTFPLAHGAPARVGRLRGYGNAINAEAARVWIECVMESIENQPNI